MSIVVLLFAVIATIILVWLANSGKVPAPFPWIIYAILVLVWLIVLLQLLGLTGGMQIGASRGG